jgi:tRNA modification GTPase
MYDTIAAISTSLGIGAISIIRLSGTDAISIVNKIFDGKDLNKAKTHTITYGHIIDKNNTIDEVLVSVMRAPKTFTTEDVVEINCHGGIATTNKILELLLNNGARLAEPGEFTKRAFLNGRIDLIEAESIMDLINSKTEKSRKLAMNQVEGKVSNIINRLRKQILSILSNIEVNIDYPEYEDILIVTNEMIEKFIKELKAELQKLLKEAENGRIIKDGIKTLILGKPNVGKSSLLNKLLDEEKAIVSDIKGTTRDVIEGSFTIDGVLFNILDTAGIRKTLNKVEKIGVERSLNLINKSDLIIVILNNNEKLSSDDKLILEMTKNKKRIIFVNKSDLKSKINIKEEAIYGSIIENKGIEKLKDKIRQMFNLEELEKDDLNYLSNSSQISKIKECLNIINDVESSMKHNFGIDMQEIDLKRIFDLLGNIIGKDLEDEVIDEIFKNFCVGK